MPTSAVNSSLVSTLKTSLTLVLQQNSELKNRLNRVHDVSDLADLSSLDPVSDTVSEKYFIQILF